MTDFVVTVTISVGSVLLAYGVHGMFSVITTALIEIERLKLRVADLEKLRGKP